MYTKRILMDPLITIMQSGSAKNLKHIFIVKQAS